MYTNKIIIELVEVIIKTKDTKDDIIKFRFKGKTYTVSKHISTWKETTGDNLITHFHLICKDQNVSCQLSHDHKQNIWTLTQMDIIH